MARGKVRELRPNGMCKHGHKLIGRTLMSFKRDGVTYHRCRECFNKYQRDFYQRERKGTPRVVALQPRVEALEKENAELRGRVAKLERRMEGVAQYLYRANLGGERRFADDKALQAVMEGAY